MQTVGISSGSMSGTGKRMQLRNAILRLADCRESKITCRIRLQRSVLSRIYRTARWSTISSTWHSDLLWKSSRLKLWTTISDGRRWISSGCRIGLYRRHPSRIPMISASTCSTVLFDRSRCWEYSLSPNMSYWKDRQWAIGALHRNTAGRSDYVLHLLIESDSERYRSPLKNRISWRMPSSEKNHDFKYLSYVIGNAISFEQF